MVDLAGILSSLFPDVTIGEHVDVEGNYDRTELTVAAGLDVDSIRVGALPPGTPVDLRERGDRSELVVDPEKAEDASWREARPALRGAWREAGEASLESAYPFVSSVRRSLDDRYGDEAYAVASLCSAGYFDEGRFFRELYRSMRATGAMSITGTCSRRSSPASRSSCS